MVGRNINDLYKRSSLPFEDDLFQTMQMNQGKLKHFN